LSANLQPILNKHFARQTQVAAADKLVGIHPGERKVIVMQYEEQQLINGLFERLKQPDNKTANGMQMQSVRSLNLSDSSLRPLLYGAVDFDSGSGAETPAGPGSGA
jgi:nitric oxide reductase activation protein